ncbi:MAG: hypothetical protein HC853_03050 [Anaerolineae bacterium]|nr:hypothetical protein [Anaerolineae bacterium]
MQKKLNTEIGPKIAAALIAFLALLAIGTFALLWLTSDPKAWQFQLQAGLAFNVAIALFISLFHVARRGTINLLTLVGIVALGILATYTYWVISRSIGLSPFWGAVLYYGVSFVVVSTTASGKALEGAEIFSAYGGEFGTRNVVNRVVQVIGLSLTVVGIFGALTLTVLSQLGMWPTPLAEQLVTNIALNGLFVTIITRLCSKESLVLSLITVLWMVVLGAVILFALWFVLVLVNMQQVIPQGVLTLLSVGAIALVAVLKAYKGQKEQDKPAQRIGSKDE